MTNLAMAKTFEERFFDQLEKEFDSVKTDIRNLTKKVDKNTEITEAVRKQALKTNGRVDKLEVQVYKKRNSPFNFIQDKQLIGLFIMAIVLFLSIIASFRGIKLPW